MNKLLHVALREFLATVVTKGFIFGILLTPLLIGIVIVVMPMLINEKAPKIDGELAIVDPTHEVVAEVTDYLKPAKIAERRGEFEKEVKENTPKALQKMGANDELTQRTLDMVLGSVPSIRVIELPAEADLEKEKARLYEGKIEDGGRLALAVVSPTATRKAEGEAKFGTYELYVREKVDDRIADEIKDGLKHSIVEARIRGAGYDRDAITQLTEVARVKSTTVTASGEQETNEFMNVFLPMGFMLVLLMSVMTGGQSLMTTTMEEKSSRVVEVLLSAVSPMQLMTGKILGQMVVGIVVMLVYTGLGIAGLVAFTLFGLLDPWLFFFLVVFYVIAYIVLGSFMAAIGAAVNEPREAQSLMMPVMLVVMIPWILWFPMSRDPNSTFATIASFLPPINSFVMMLRLSSTTPPPIWQAWVSVGIGLVSVWGALWFAAKIFRIGLLLHGKPPNFATLVRWVRMA